MLFAAALGTKEVVVSRARLYVEEGAAVEYAVALGEEPTRTVAVSIAVGDVSLVRLLTSSVLPFSARNWTTPQPVLVRARENAVDTGLLAADVSLSHSAISEDVDYNGASVSVWVRVYDDDSCVRDCLAGTYASLCNGVPAVRVPRDTSVRGEGERGQCLRRHAGVSAMHRGLLLFGWLCAPCGLPRRHLPQRHRGVGPRTVPPVC